MKILSTVHFVAVFSSNGTEQRGYHHTEFLMTALGFRLERHFGD